MTVLYILGGLVLLVVGGDLLVRWASRLATGLGVSSMVVGLTVVAFGTSAPELAVSLAAAWNGKPEIALGNVVGSNIFNVLFILGLSALVAPLVVHRSFLRRELPIMIVSSILVMVVALDGRVSRPEGLFLFAGAVAFTWWLVQEGRRQTRLQNAKQTKEPEVADEQEEDAPPPRMALLVLGILFSLGLLVAGSKLLVAGATAVAQALGVSDLVIGLTIVAAGTSLPEVAASVAATLRGERDMAIGNVVGSNIFNILIVLGGSAALSPIGMAVPPAAMAFDIPVMIAVALLCLPVFLSGARISRLEGFLLLALYAGYTALLGLASVGAVVDRSSVMTGFVAAVALVLGWEFWRARRPVAEPD